MKFEIDGGRYVVYRMTYRAKADGLGRRQAGSSMSVEEVRPSVGTEKFSR